MNGDIFKVFFALSWQTIHYKIYEMECELKCHKKFIVVLEVVLIMPQIKTNAH